MFNTEVLQTTSQKLLAHAVKKYCGVDLVPVDRDDSRPLQLLVYTLGMMDARSTDNVSTLFDAIKARFNWGNEQISECLFDLLADRIFHEGTFKETYKEEWDYAMSFYGATQVRWDHLDDREWFFLSKELHSPTC